MRKRQPAFRFVPKNPCPHLDKILHELFNNGGPMRPVDGRKRKPVIAETPKHRPDPCLLAEQQRLIRTWDKE